MTGTDYATRSQDEIVARIRMHEVGDDSMFGWAREVLAGALDYEHAKPFLRDGVTAAEWEANRTVNFVEAAKGYLSFAIEKINGHRGISAERSVQKQRLLNIGMSVPGGAVYQIWYLTRDQAEAIAETLGEPNEEHFQSNAELNASNALTEYAWLLGRDDVVAAMDEADYRQYGAPKVKAFADGMGWPWPDGEDFARMARGERCSDDCDAGCAP